MSKGWRSGRTGFGWIELDSMRYENDIIIHTDLMVSKRKKHLSKKHKAKYGHTPLSNEELDFIRDEKPDILFIGTGQSGALPFTNDALTTLNQYKTIIRKTPDILDLFIKETRPYIAILHLTC